MAETAEILASLVERFRPEAAQGLHVVYQLNLTGEDGGDWHITVADQKCTLSSGIAPESDMGITMQAQDWKELVAGRLNAFDAFLQGKIQIVGDMSLAGQIQTLFGL